MDKKFMLEAIKEAREGINSLHGGPFGAVIVKDGLIVGRGHNQVVLQHDPTCHGEVMAIHDACKNLGTFDLSGCVIYTTGEPCPMCKGAILWANIKKVYFGCDIYDTEKIGFRDNVFYNFKDNEFMKQICHEECLELYDEYNSISNRTNY